MFCGHVCQHIESNIFLCIFGILIFSDVIQRLEYKFGSVWTLYLIILNWILIGIISLSFSLVLANLFEIDMSNVNNTFLESVFVSCQCVGLYPLILNLTLIESILLNPFEIDALFFGFVYVPNVYIPIVWSLIYVFVIRWDLSIFAVLLFTIFALKIRPFNRIYHLSMYRIKKFEFFKFCIVFCCYCFLFFIFFLGDITL